METLKFLLDKDTNGNEEDRLRQSKIFPYQRAITIRLKELQEIHETQLEIHRQIQASKKEKNDRETNAMLKLNAECEETLKIKMMHNPPMKFKISKNATTPIFLFNGLGLKEFAKPLGPQLQGFIGCRIAASIIELRAKKVQRAKNLGLKKEN